MLYWEYDSQVIVLLISKKKLTSFCPWWCFLKNFGWFLRRTFLPLPNWESLELFSKTISFIITFIICSSPIPNVPVYYIDISSSGGARIFGPSLATTVYTDYNFAQQVELTIWLFTLPSVRPTNLVNDTAFVFGLLPWIVTASLNPHNHVVQDLLHQLQALL